MADSTGSTHPLTSVFLAANAGTDDVTAIAASVAASLGFVRNTARKAITA